MVMKTSIKSLIATALMTVVVSTSTVYAYTPVVKTVSANAVDVSSIKKVIVTGNVEVTLVQSPKSKTLYKKENDAYVHVKQVGSSLLIDTKNSTENAKITVYVDEIYRVDASGNAVVETKDALKLDYLQIFLKDNAKADINSVTTGLYTSLIGASELRLQGSTATHVVAMDRLSKITMERFSAVKTETKPIVFPEYTALNK
jgi:hypothetical protein